MVQNYVYYVYVYTSESVVGVDSFRSNCNSGIIKTQKRIILLIQSPWVLTHDTSEATKLMLDETDYNIKSEKVCKYFSDTAMPSEPFLHNKFKHRAFKKENCYVLSDSLQKLCLEASAMPNGKWFILFRVTYMHLKVNHCIYIEQSSHLHCSYRIRLSQLSVFWPSLNLIPLLKAGESKKSYTLHTTYIWGILKNCPLTHF